MMLKFKNITINNQVILAPMAGITNVAYREFCHPFGIGITYTEMVSDCGLIYENKETYRYLEISKSEHPVGVQLFGGSKETLLKAIKIIEKLEVPCDFIDINLGCPVPKVVKTNAGSAWLKRLDELGDMMKSLVNETRLPLTAKIRIGWDENSINVYDTVKVLEENGISLIAIHPRTRNQFYNGKANYEIIRDLGKIMTVPLIVSGDIFTLEDAIYAIETTGASGVMVARGALGNPYLITQIDHYLRYKEKLPNPTLKKQIEYLKEYAQKLILLKGEDIAMRELRGIAPHFLKGYPNVKQIKNRLTQNMKTYKDLVLILEEINY